MPGLLSAMEGFCVIGIVIATGYVAARMRIGGPTAQMVLNRFSFFVSSPCLMFAILSKEKIFEIFHSSIVVAFFSAVLVGVVFLILNRLFFHMKAADATNVSPCLRTVRCGCFFKNTSTASVSGPSSSLTE